MNEQVYKKVKGRYYPIGYSDGWSGFPTDGIWLVQTKDGCKSSECIMKIGDIQELHPSIDIIAKYKDRVVKYLQKQEGKLLVHNESYYGAAMDLLKYISNESNFKI